MLYEIKQKQQKMPKARANINVYSNTRFSGYPLIWSCLTVSFSCGIVYSRGNRTPESENKQTSVYLIKRKMKKKVLYTYQVRIHPLLLSCCVVAKNNSSNRRPKHRSVKNRNVEGRNSSRYLSLLQYLCCKQHRHQQQQQRSQQEK